DPSATPTCPQDTFRTGSCPSDTQVGTVATTVIATVLVIPTQLDLSGAVYNLQPAPDEPARLGIRIDALGGLSTIRLESSIRTRLTDYGLDTITRDIPRQSAGLDVEMKSMALTLWGPKGAHPTLAKPFVTVPTSCQPATTTIDATAHDGTATGGSDTFTPTDCDHVPFN